MHKSGELFKGIVGVVLPVKGGLCLRRLFPFKQLKFIKVERKLPPALIIPLNW